MNNKEKAKIVTSKLGSVLNIGIGDEEMVWLVADSKYTMHGVCDIDYTPIKRLKDRNFRSNDHQTFYNCDWRDLPDNKWDNISFNLKSREELEAIIPNIKKILVPEGTFVFNWNSWTSDELLARLCSDNDLSLRWIRLSNSLAPIISYKEKTKWISIKR